MATRSLLKSTAPASKKSRKETSEIAPPLQVVREKLEPEPMEDQP